MICNIHVSVTWILHFYYCTSVKASHENKNVTYMYWGRSSAKKITQLQYVQNV